MRPVTDERALKGEHSAEKDVPKIVRDWVTDVAYAEDDFVLNAQEGGQLSGTPTEVTQLLDALDPDWRSAFTRVIPPGSK